MKPTSSGDTEATGLDPFADIRPALAPELAALPAGEITRMLGPRAALIALSGSLGNPDLAQSRSDPARLRVLAQLFSEAAEHTAPDMPSEAGMLPGATEYQVPPHAAATVTPVLQLDKIEAGSLTVPFVRSAAGGFAAWFGLGTLPSPMVQLKITGRVMVPNGTIQRPLTRADRKQRWWPAEIVSLVYMPRGPGAANATSPLATAADNGSFVTEATVTTDPGTTRLHLLVQATLRDGRKVTADALLQRNDLEVLLAIVDEQEKVLVEEPGLTHLQFLHAVRKIFQPPPGSPFAALFDALLYRQRDIPALFDLSSPEGSRIHRFENLEIDGTTLDIGHVLTAIEGSRRQQPQLGSHGFGPWHWPMLFDDDLEATVTWGGDFGLALASYLEDKAAGRTADLASYLKAHAGSADLIGDIDGINIGAVYDENKSLADNLRAYYGTRPLRRFHSFIANSRSDTKQPIFTLVPGQPKLDAASRKNFAHYALMFAQRKLAFASKLTPAQLSAVLPIVQEGSAAPEIAVATNYFVDFLEAGLAREAP